MIDVEGLTKVYARGRGDGTRALDAVTFAVPARSIYGFLGPNGAGKTTAIRILATILPATEGRATVAGHDIHDAPLKVQSSIGYMPEFPGFYPTMTAEEHLDYWGRFYGMSRAARRKRAKELLDLVGLGEERTKKLKAYSHGMHKRFGLAQALLHDPPVLILDEPAGGLDPRGIVFFRNLLRQLSREGKTIFLSSHILSEVQQTSSHVGVIHRGRIVASGTLEAIQSRIVGTGIVRILVETPSVPEQVLDELRSLSRVKDVTCADWGLIVSATADIRAEINGYLVQRGVVVRGIKLAEVTLEDAFIALTGGAPT